MKTSIFTTNSHLDQRGSVQPLKRHYLWTKYLIAIILLIAVVANGLVGYHLFRVSDYDFSHVLVLASYACIVGTIYFLTVYKQRRIG